MGSDDIKKLNEIAQNYSDMLNKLQGELSRVIVGQSDVSQKVILGLIANGHILIEGVPGLAKTLMIESLASGFNCDFVRLQFTPDLLPADITGTKIYDHDNSVFKIEKGPIFSNFILADEINRAPPKVQSALLEAMQERQVTIHGQTFEMKKPFLILATQNPIESEGTYKLPEAQVDRFMFKVLIGYPNKKEEGEIIKRFTGEMVVKISKVLSPKNILDIQKFCRKVYVDDKIEDYVAEIVDATRNPSDYGLDLDSKIDFGASPRASLWLILAAKANALFHGRGYVIPEDVKEVSHEVLRHRIILSYEAEADEITSDEVIDKIFNKIKVP
ncbi:MAG: MoxR family ATPase [Nanoarchaeota archaeon]|nr:MoxR family ATPase [Nanoarchaeota archaeon]